MRLERKRRCGWAGHASDDGGMVWARGGVVSAQCPRTAIKAESMAWLEMYAAWRVTRVSLAEMSARDVDAMAVLEREWEKAGNDER